MFWSERIGIERLLQRLVERAEFIEGCTPLVRRLSGFGRSDPFSDGVSRKLGTLGYLMQRELVAEVHPPDFSQHFHADHPVFSCSKSEQKKLNHGSVFGQRQYARTSPVTTPLQSRLNWSTKILNNNPTGQPISSPAP